jgi:hypothetical protein
MVDPELSARLDVRLWRGYEALVGLRLGVCVIADTSDRGQGQMPLTA